MGLAPAGPDNPLSALVGGPLACLGGVAPLASHGGTSPGGFALIAADACLGVPGTPQSATGGTSLFTGVNAPVFSGGHLQGYPNTKLKELIAREGLLRKARERGARVGFANAYTSRFFERGRTRHRSVTTVMAETAGIPLRREANLKRGEAVCRDFTNRILVDSGLEIDLLPPEEAGARLGRMAGEGDLLLYEYFQTDVVGHRGTFEDALEVVEGLNLFLGAAVAGLDPECDVFVLSSDHGNVEDMSTSSHTLNKVPILLWGKGLRESGFSSDSPSILDVSRGIHALLGCR